MNWVRRLFRSIREVGGYAREAIGDMWRTERIGLPLVALGVIYIGVTFPWAVWSNMHKAHL